MDTSRRALLTFFCNIVNRHLNLSHSDILIPIPQKGRSKRMNISLFALRGLLFVSLALGLSNFAAAIDIGLGGVDAKTRLKTGLAFGFFEALMPIIGLVIGQGLVGVFGTIGHYVGAGLLILTGAYSLWKALKENNKTKPAKKPDDEPNMKLGHLLLTGFALSIDNLVVGFALSLYHVPIFLAAGVIAVVSVAMSLVGLELGKHLSKRLEKWSEEAGRLFLSWSALL